MCFNISRGHICKYFFQICANLIPRNDSLGRPEQWSVVQPNPGVMGPYAHKGNQWVGYDDVESVARKAEYVAEQGLAGYLIYIIIIMIGLFLYRREKITSRVYVSSPNWITSLTDRSGGLRD